jgi:hypothetical protein
MGAPTWKEIEMNMWDGINGYKPNLDGSVETQDTGED